jgi:hypothetical protein
LTPASLKDHSNTQLGGGAPLSEVSFLSFLHFIFFVIYLFSSLLYISKKLKN